MKPTQWLFCLLTLFSLFSTSDALRAGELVSVPPVSLKGHTGTLTAVALDDSGEHVLSAGVDKTVIAWDAAAKKELGKFTGTGQPVTAATISADGKQALVAYRDKTVELWDVSPNKTAPPKIVATFPKFKENVTALAFNLDATQFVTGTAGGDLWLWDTSNMKTPVQAFKRHTKSIGAVAFSQDGLSLISGGADKVVVVWETETGKPLTVFDDGHTGPVLSVALDSAGRYALSGSSDKTAILWNILEEKRVGRLTTHKDAVVMVAFQSGDSFLTASKDKTVLRWDMKGNQLDQFKSDVPIVCGRSNMDGSVIVLGLQNGEVTVLKLYGDIQRPGPVGGLDGRRQATESKNDTATAAEPTAKAATGEDRLVFRFEGHGDQVTSVAYGSVERNFVSSSKEGRAILWSFDGTNTKSAALSVGKDAYGAAVLGDNRSVVVAAEDLSVFFWNAASKAPAKMLNAHSAPLTCVTAMKSGSGWASGGRDFNIYLWNGGGNDAVGKLTGHKEAIMGIAFNKDGSRLASASADKTVGIWDTRSKKGLQQLKGHTNVVRCVAFSPDGKQLASGSFDNTAKLWDVQTGKMIREFKGHDKGVFGIALSNDGKRLFTGGGDRTIIIWDVETGEKLETLTGQNGAVTGLSMSPEGDKLLSSGGKEVLLWDVSASQ